MFAFRAQQQSQHVSLSLKVSANAVICTFQLEHTYIVTYIVACTVTCVVTNRCGAPGCMSSLVSMWAMWDQSHAWRWMAISCCLVVKTAVCASGTWCPLPGTQSVIHPSAVQPLSIRLCVRSSIRPSIHLCVSPTVHAWVTGACQCNVIFKQQVTWHHTATK